MRAMNAAATPIEPGTTVVPLRQDAKVIALVGLAHAISHFSHLLLPPMFPLFMSEFNLSFSQVGFLVSLFFVISGSGQMLSGFVVDRVGARPVLFATLVLFAMSAISAASATGYTGLLISAALAGLGNAPFHPIDYTILNQRVSAPRLGYAFSAHGLTGNLGWALTPVWLVVWTAWFDWRVAYLSAAVLYMLVLAVLFVHRDLLKTDTVVRSSEPHAQSELAFLKLPVVWWCFGYFLLSTMTLSVVQSYAPSILKAVHGVGLQAASLTLTAYMLCAAAGVLVGGFVAARQAHRSEKVVAIAMAAGALILLLCATGGLGASGTMVGLAVTGFAVGVGGPSRDMMIKRATPKGATGRVYGMVYSGLDVGFALAPLVFGVLMDRGLFSFTLTGAAFTLLCSVGAALMVGKLTHAAVPQRSI
jgi:MFS transporter, FSR family, fosmidomycin resistance protein